MRKELTPRFWIEATVGSVTGSLALITAIFPDWIELISGWDPDQHDGSVESLVVIALFAATAVIYGLALIEWTRASRSAPV